MSLDEDMELDAIRSEAPATLPNVGDQDVETIVDMLRGRSKQQASRIALRFLGPDGDETEVLDYRELDRRARAIAARLRNFTSPVDRAIILLPSGPDYVAAFFGCLYAGVIAVPAYPPDPLRPHHVARLAGMIADAKPAAALTDAAAFDAVVELCRSDPGIHVEIVADLAADFRRPSQHVAVRGEDLAFLQYTSGSTSAPKGVEVTHANLLANQRILVRGFGLDVDDICVSWLPLYHDMGLIAGLILPIFLGIPLVLMPPEQFLARPARWLSAIHRYRGTMSGAPDFAFRLAAERTSAGTLNGLDLSSWRVAFCGAEPVRAETMAMFAARFAATGFAAEALHPSYGLAEATLMVSGDRRMVAHRTLRVDAAALACGRIVAGSDGPELAASGLPVEPDALRIVHPQTLVSCGEDEVGEVWVSGPSVARGYWRNPSATADVFIERDCARWLRTGDLAFLHDGYLFITGRAKDVIIVRGENRYPQDIELAVEQGVTAVRKGRVAAFAVPFEGREGIGVAAEISRPARRSMPAAKILAAIDAVIAETQQEPAALIALLEPGGLPKTTSGKLQRSACRSGLESGELAAFELCQRPVGSSGDSGSPALESETERRLASIWAEVLGIDGLSAGDRFLALGGHSLLAARAAARIDAAFGVELPLSEMFAPRTLREFARRLDAMPRRGGGAPIGPRDPGEEVPLSPSQRRIWISEQLGGADAGDVYDIVVEIDLSGPLSAEALEAALAGLVERHEVLRTDYVDIGSEIVARISSLSGGGRAPSIPNGSPPNGSDERPHDLGWPAWVPTGETPTIGDAPRSTLRATFFPQTGRRGLRAALYQSAEDRHSLVLAIHHLVCDGWSMGVLLRDLGALYEAARDGTPAPSPLRAQYADFALWQRRGERSGAFEPDKAFWRARLADAPKLLALPTDFARPDRVSHAGDGVRFVLPPELVDRLETLGRRYDSTLYMVALAAFDAVLFRWCGVRDLLVGADVANRPRPELEALVGFFMNVVPLRAKPSGALPFDGLLVQVRDDALAAFDHQNAPFDQIVEVAGVPRDPGRTPLVQVLCVMQSAVGDLGIDGLSGEMRQAPATSSKFDMALFMQPKSAGGLDCEWVFATALFAKVTIERLAAAWRALLGQIVEAPQRPLAAFDLPSLETAMSAPQTGTSAGKGTRMGAKLDKLTKFAGATRRPQAETGSVKTSTLTPGATIPLVIEPAGADLDASAWAADNRAAVERMLLRHGGLLFRGFGLETVQDFEAFAEALHPGLYGGYGDLPKKEGGKNTYRSTPYPEEKMILFHNESSHLPRWPRKQWFFCEQPSPVGGATPIVDCRELYQRLPGKLATIFEQRGLTYLRTFARKLDVDWRDFFCTQDRAEVEAACRAQGVDFAWLDGDELQTRIRCPAVIVHPLTGERSFFNQIQLHHTHSLEPGLREDLLSMVGSQRMPRQVTFGDGSPITDEVMDLVGELYEACAVRFEWRAGDVVMLDNMLAAHARDPFEGPRRIVVAMGDMVDRGQVETAATSVVR